MTRMFTQTCGSGPVTARSAHPCSAEEHAHAPSPDRRRRIPARRRALPHPLRRTALFPRPSRPLARPAAQGPSHGAQHGGDVRSVEPPPAAARRVPHGRRPRPDRVPRSRGCRGAARTPAARPLHLRRMGGGGLPSWLLADPAMRLRSRDPNFLAAVDDYFGRLLPPLRDRLASRGGPVLAVQVENEYGAYGRTPPIWNTWPAPCAATASTSRSSPVTSRPTWSAGRWRECSPPPTSAAGRRHTSPRCGAPGRPGHCSARSSGSAGSTGGAATTSSATRSRRPKSSTSCSRRGPP